MEPTKYGSNMPDATAHCARLHKIVHWRIGNHAKSVANVIQPFKGYSVLGACTKNIMYYGVSTGKINNNIHPARDNLYDVLCTM